VKLVLPKRHPTRLTCGCGAVKFGTVDGGLEYDVGWGMGAEDKSVCVGVTVRDFTLYEF
jgi:hypothetical protein